MADAKRLAADRSSRSLWTTMVAAASLVLAGSQVGCSRMFWRSQADFDAYNQLLEKTQDPRWDLPRVTVEADPRSRFFDTYDPDVPPLPPDDPAAGIYMQVVDKMPGYKSWHKFGESMSVENPQWLATFPFEPAVAQATWEVAGEEASDQPRPSIPTIHALKLEEAIELANINSRDYQTQIENVFLSSLLLTFDRFQFNVRYLGLNGGEPGGQLNYLNTPSVRDDLQYSNRFGVSQLLPTGGQWVLELANNTLWMFSGDNQTSSSSLLSYSITQPLLLGAGRKIVLENLTQSEREVLYDIRTLARFRKIFFSDIVVNGNGGGFLGLLRQQQQVNNQRGNIAALAVQIERLRAVNALQREPLEDVPGEIKVPDEFRGRLNIDRIRNGLAWQGVMDPTERDRLLQLSDDPTWQQAIQNLFSRTQSGVITLDLAQLLTRLSSQENSLRDAERQLLDSLDQYKLELGLPTDFQISLNTELLKQFELIDPRIDVLERKILDFQQQLSTINEEDPSPAELQRALAGIEELRQSVRRDGMDLIEEDFRRVDAILESRLQRVSDPQDREIIVKDLERNRVVYRDVVVYEFNQASDLLQSLRADLEKPNLPLATRRDAFMLAGGIREDLLQLAQSLRAVQAGLRSELITLQDFNMTQEEVVQLAVENRLDLMNARAQVMDARRQMEVAANRLEAVVNVIASGDVGTSGGNKPFDFRGDRSIFRAGVQFTAPLDQVLERNAYRASQIEYQRARRAYMQLEDQVKLEVRTEWRQLQVLRQNFETARQNLRIAAVQLDSSIENVNAPVRPGTTSSQSGNLGLNLLNALQSVLNAQNELIRIWVQYEQNRINIHRDMDIMQVDERGLWIDPVYQNLSTYGRESPTQSEPANESLPPAPLLGVDAAIDTSGAADRSGAIDTSGADPADRGVSERQSPPRPDSLPQPVRSLAISDVLPVQRSRPARTAVTEADFVLPAVVDAAQGAQDPGRPGAAGGDGPGWRRRLEPVSAGTWKRVDAGSGVDPAGFQR